MDLINVLITISAILILALGILILLKQSKEQSNRAFFILSITLALWSFAMVVFRASTDESAVQFWGRILYSSAALIPPAFLYFVLAFTNFFQKSRHSIIKVAIWMLGAAALVSFSIPNFFIMRINFLPDAENTIDFNKIVAWIYAVYFVIIFALGLLRIFTRVRHSRGIEKIQLRYVFIGAVVPISIASITNLLMPIMGNFQLNWFGNITVVAVSISFSYAIIKHHLLNIRVVATEIFTGAILVVSFSEIPFSSSFPEFIVRTAIFILILIFGILLIRGTLREIKELERLSQAKTEFLSIASHQLRTPLSANKGYLSMLLEGSFGKIKEKHKKVLRRIYISNERLVRLVDDFLNVSRAEEGRLEYRFEKINIIDMIESALDELRMEAEDKGLEIIWNKPQQALPLIRGDRLKLRQVIMNLIDNAIKYTPQGLVEISAGIENNFLRIKVSDTGIGLSKNDQQTLFQRFSRSRGAKRANTGGSGLGLFLAKKIVEAHQGNIQAESAGRGKGSTFIVELPIK